jgi:hypothetical protein
VTRLAARLGRHAILLTARMLEEMPSVVEPICYDHFETLGVSQFVPVGIGTPAYPVDTRPRAVDRRTAASEAHNLRSTVKSNGAGLRPRSAQWRQLP